MTPSKPDKLERPLAPQRALALQEPFAPQRPSVLQGLFTFAPPGVSAPTLSCTPKYLIKNLQQIIKVLLESQASTLAFQLLVYLEGLYKRFLKACAPDVYHNKIYLECYNFCQQCKDHFATADAKSQNRVPFAAFFLKDKTLLRWQQHKYKLDGETTVLIT